MNQFAVFAYDCYYPCGGWSDHLESFPNSKDAIKAVREWMSSEHRFDCYEVIDLASGKMIFTSGQEEEER